MTAIVSETPAWAGVFIEWLHPASLICGLLFPLVRASLLTWRGLPAHSTAMWIELIASGFTFPSFIALAISFMAPAIRAQVDGHALALAGAMGIVYTVASVVKTEREEQHRMSRF